jgi:hypothetical protein
MRSDLDDEQECGFDRDRHALAQLLLSRNRQMAGRWWLSRVTAPRRGPTAIIASYCRCHPSCTTPRVLTLATFCRRHAPTLSGQKRSTA